MRIIKALANFILFVTLFVCTLMLQFCLFLHTELYNKQVYYKVFYSQNFYSYTETSINKDFKVIQRECNLPDTVFKNTVTKDWIKQQADGSVSNSIDYMEYKADKIQPIDVSSQSKNFNNNLDSYIKSLGVTLDRSSENELNSVKNNVSNILKNETSFFSLQKLTSLSSFQKARKLIFSFYSKLYLIAILLIINLLLLFIINKKSICRFLNLIGYAFFCVGISTLFPALFALKSGFVNRIAISIDVVRNILASSINGFLYYFIFTGGIIAALGLILIICAFIKHNNNVKKVENS